MTLSFGFGLGKPDGPSPPSLSLPLSSFPLPLSLSFALHLPKSLSLVFLSFFSSSHTYPFLFFHNSFLRKTQVKQRLKTKFIFPFVNKIKLINSHE